MEAAVPIIKRWHGRQTPLCCIQVVLVLWTSARHAWDHLLSCFNLHEQTEKAEAEACLADE